MTLVVSATSTICAGCAYATPWAAAPDPIASLATIMPMTPAARMGMPTARGTAGDMVSFLQTELHPSPLAVLPSSHSYPFCWMPSPHSSWQLKQPSPATPLPSSHCSVLLLLTTASPQNSNMQSAEHPSPLTTLKSPHT